MPIVDPEVFVVVLAEKQSGTQKVFFESALCSANSAGELWLENGSGHTVLFQPEDYYDEQLRNLRNSNSMVSPRDPKIQLTLLGQVWGATIYDPATHIELSRSKYEAQ